MSNDFFACLSSGNESRDQQTLVTFVISVKRGNIHECTSTEICHLLDSEGKRRASSHLSLSTHYS